MYAYGMQIWLEERHIFRDARGDSGNSAMLGRNQKQSKRKDACLLQNRHVLRVESIRRSNDSRSAHNALYVALVL
jgi:hypothetical protein